jgi:16S rRNA C967 or C1407 C5-methylase (RsmB/RsmF family)
MVVANDPDSKRIETLKKRYAQSGSPNLLITCATAAELADNIKTHAPSRRVFDRIVCDVPW